MVHAAHGIVKLPLTLFRPPLPQHAPIVPQGKALDYVDQSNLYKSTHNQPGGFLHNAYGNTQGGLAQKIYRKQAPKTDSLARNQTAQLEWVKSKLLLSSNTTVLEANAGTSVLGRFLAPFVKSVTASDVSRHMLHYAKEKGGDKINTVIADTSELPFAEESFDLVISRFALNHFEDISIPLKELARVVKTGGHIAILERVPHPTILKHRNRLDYLENIRDVSHVTFYTPSEISSGLLKTGLIPSRSATIFGEDATANNEVHQELTQYLDLNNTKFQNRLLLTQAIESNAHYPDTQTAVDQVSGFQSYFGQDHKVYIVETHALILARK